MSEDIRHIAKDNDCISSIAEKYGHFWETVWNHPENAELKKKRGDPNVLYSGDEVFVPALREGSEQIPTEKRHRFRRKGVPAMARWRFRDEKGNPRAGIEYVLIIDDEKTVEGKTDSDGVIEVPISPEAKEARLTLRDGEHEEHYRMELGGMDPVSEESGAIKRLENLGVDCGRDGDRFEQGLKEFQLNHGLEATGKLDEQTQKKLLEEHGC
ncbi:MAG: peptidoglycan-binding protein [Planctomycetes bacterium]|nr:peptidoglycan-binding protein [Planctomycetota bacterium]